MLRNVLRLVQALPKCAYLLRIEQFPKQITYSYLVVAAASFDLLALPPSTSPTPVHDNIYHRPPLVWVLVVVALFVVLISAKSLRDSGISSARLSKRTESIYQHWWATTPTYLCSWPVKRAYALFARLNSSGAGLQRAAGPGCNHLKCRQCRLQVQPTKGEKGALGFRRRPIETYWTESTGLMKHMWLWWRNLLLSLHFNWP